MAGKSKIDNFLILLREAIIAGDWRIGDKLPPEEYFMEHFQVSRTLLREAMKFLIAEGILIRRHGSGTYLQAIPRKRIELYVRLENIISTGANWFRWQIEQMKKNCHTMDYELEVLVSYGDTPTQEAASFTRHLNCPLSSDVVSSLILFYSADLEEKMRQRGGHFVTLTTVCGADFADSAVVLDYEKMGVMMKNAVAEHNAAHPCLVYIDDKAETVGQLHYKEMHALYDTVMPDKKNQFAIHSYNDIDGVFGKWLEENGDKCDLLVFTDDETAKLVFSLMARTKREFPQLSCITHGNEGLLTLPKPDIKSLEIIGFELQQAADAAWRLLHSPRTGELIKIAPKIIKGGK